MKVFYSSQYVSSSGSIDTVKKNRWISKQIRREGGTVTAPTDLTPEDAKVLHNSNYVDDLFALRITSATTAALGEWDASLLTSIKASNGGILCAVDAAMQDGVAGSLSSGLHHAGISAGKGYCTINGLALGAIKAVKAGKRVGILDVDAHCGGGTYRLLSRPEIKSLGEYYIYDLSTNYYDDWASNDTERFVLNVYDRKSNYLDEVQKALDFLKSKNINFLMHNAGMDSMTNDGLSMELMEKREEMVANWCVENNVQCCWALAGGYVSNKSHTRNQLEPTEELDDPDTTGMPIDPGPITKEVLVEAHMKTYRAMKKAFQSLI